MSKSFNSHSGSVLKQQTNWRDLWFYKKAVVLYQLTYVFTRRFLPAYGDRTVDQMVQAARSGKQNIVGGYGRWRYIYRYGVEVVERGACEYSRVVRRL